MIHVEDLTKYYHDFCAVDHINFDVSRGEILGLLGPNGAGKTTTLKMLTGFFPPTRGDIRIKDLSVAKNPLEIKQMLGYLPESSPFYRDMLVYDYLGYVAAVRGITAGDIPDRLKDLAGLCGLSEVMHKAVGELSKGLNQRVGLAHAMMSDPEILILDEPTQGLDPNQIVEIRSLIKEIGAEKTVIFSTHILSEAEATCDRIMIIDQGKIVADDATEALKQGAQQGPALHLTLKNADAQSVRNRLESVQGVQAVHLQENAEADALGVTLGCASQQDLGYLADHGTLELFSRRRSRMNKQQRQSIGNFHQLVSQTYTIKQVNLSDEPIPEGLNCLVIAEPTKSFTDYELYKIDQALMRGTNLAIFTPGLKQAKSPKKAQAMRSPATYVPMDTGLEKLLAHYGIRVKPAYVMDKNCYEQKMPRRLGGGRQPVYYAPIIKNKNINHAPAFMKNIKGVVTLENSPVQIKENIAEKNDLSARPLFSSSAQSWLVKENIRLNPMMIQPPQAEEKFGSHGLAHLVEGRFPSYFAGKEIPAKKSSDKARGKAQKSNEPGARDASAEKAPAEDAGGESAAETKASAIRAENRFMARGNPAKVLLVGSSGMLTDNVIDSKGESPNAAFVMNVIDGLNGRSEIAVLRSKTQQFNPLEETAPAVRSLVRTGNIAGLPVLVALCGLLVWWRRSTRRRHIRKMFAE